MNTSDTETKSIGLQNLNNMIANATLRKTGNFTDIISLEKNFTILQPNETQWINFIINPKNPGNYTVDIVSTLVLENGEGVALASQIIVFATGEPVAEKPDQQSKNPLISLWNNIFNWLKGWFGK